MQQKPSLNDSYCLKPGLVLGLLKGELMIGPVYLEKRSVPVLVTFDEAVVEHVATVMGQAIEMGFREYLFFSDAFSKDNQE